MRQGKMWSLVVLTAALLVGHAAIKAQAIPAHAEVSYLYL